MKPAPRTTPADLIAGGFTDPVLDAQGVFRQVLNAMARPGTLVSLNLSFEGPGTLSPAMAALCLTLLDFETPVWSDLDHSDPSLAWLRFHCGCPLVANPGDGAFVLVTVPDHLPDIKALNPGSEQFPESGTTLIVEAAHLSTDTGRTLKGPGIKVPRQLAAAGLPALFWRQRQNLNAGYPLGVDVILTAGRELCALPRTTIVEA